MLVFSLFPLPSLTPKLPIGWLYLSRGGSLREVLPLAWKIANVIFEQVYMNILSEVNLGKLSSVLEEAELLAEGEFKSGSALTLVERA